MLKGKKLKLLLGMVAGGYIIKTPECYDFIEQNVHARYSTIQCEYVLPPVIVPPEPEVEPSCWTW